MLCPNDNVDMGLVKVESHYGSPITVDQCKQCGGIWFDEMELHQIKQGEAHRVEELDAEKFLAVTSLSNKELRCPRGGETLIRFEDVNFPRELAIERCPACRGFWF